VLRALPERGQQVTPAGMQTAKSIIESRVNTLGVSSPSVFMRGGDEIVVQFEGVPDPKNVAALIGKTGRLEFFDFEKDLASPTVTTDGEPTPETSLYRLLTQIKPQAKKGMPEAYYLLRARHIVQGPAPNLHQLLLAYDGKQPSHTQIFSVPAYRLVVRSPGGKLWYLLKYFPNRPDGPPELNGSDLVESSISAQRDPGSGQPVVVIQFTQHGAKEFQKIRKAEYLRGQLNAGNAGQAGNDDPAVVQQYAGHDAIVLDGVLQSTPSIDYTDGALSDGIGGGQVQIAMGSVPAAKDLALVLQSGSLPYTFREVARAICAA
jgi:preprotein translocase subunit SecD